MSRFEELSSRLRSDAPHELVATAGALGTLGDERAVEPLLELMEKTADPAVRDAAAMALRDLSDPRALRPLLDLIADPKTEGHRGTLVYAVGGFDCAGIVPQLVQLVVDGNFEVSRQAFSVIESIEGEIAPKDWSDGIALLHGALSSAGDEKRALLEELLELFEAAE